MIIGVPKEIKRQEHRVGIVPNGVEAFVSKGHQVVIQRSAGLGSGIFDEDYQQVGATILDTIEEVYDKADMIMKVKEPLPEEVELFKEGQILYTYLHLASAPELTQGLLDKKIIGIAYETIQLEDGSLPLLRPMSMIAGKISVQVGAYFLQKEKGGSGVLLGGVPGVPCGKVAIIGGGIVGTCAAQVAVGMGASVTILDVSIDRLVFLEELFGTRINTLISNSFNIQQAVTKADLVVGAVLIPGAKAPKLVTREMISTMRKGSVVVDVAVDQGGCIETIKPTTHDNPIYEVEGVVHYGVTNMPGAVARTSTYALTNVTLPYALDIAKKGPQKAFREDKNLLKGVNVYLGKLVCPPVAEGTGIACSPIYSIL